MGGYNEIFHTWQPWPVAAPTVLLRADKPLSGMVVDQERARDWRAYWPVPHSVIDVPGDHFTVLEHDTPTTVQAIRNWIVGLEGHTVPGPALL